MVFLRGCFIKFSAYSDERQLIGGSNDTTPMASFIGGSNSSFQPYEGSGRRTATNIYPVQEEFSEEPIQPESFHQEEQSIPPMIEMSSSSNDNNSPRDELYQESGFGGERNSGIGGAGLILGGVALNNDVGESGSLTTKDFNDQMDQYDQGQGGHGLDMPEVNTNAQQGFPVQPVGSDKRVSQVFGPQENVDNGAYENPAFDNNGDMNGDTFANDDANPNYANPNYSRWERNRIKEETREKLDQEQKSARERMKQVRRQLSLLARESNENVQTIVVSDFSFNWVKLVVFKPFFRNSKVLQNKV